MRTDIAIDKKQVRLPLSCLTGFSKCRARFGDVVLFTEDGNLQIGRIIGRIAEGDLKNHLVCSVLSYNMQFSYERWVNPEDVQGCWEAKHYQTDFLLRFFGADYLKGSTTEIRQRLFADNR